jgi:hypothetical protein
MFYVTSLSAEISLWEYIRILKNKLIKLKKQEDRTLWLSHGTCSYICVYINAVADSVMLCLQHDFYNIIFKITHKLCITWGSAPPPPKAKIMGAPLLLGNHRLYQDELRCISSHKLASQWLLSCATYFHLERQHSHRFTATHPHAEQYGTQCSCTNNKRQAGWKRNSPTVTGSTTVPVRTVTSHSRRSLLQDCCLVSPGNQDVRLILCRSECTFTFVAAFTALSVFGMIISVNEQNIIWKDSCLR